MQTNQLSSLPLISSLFLSLLFRSCRSAVLKMRKLIPCYLSAFTTVRQLQGRLFAAQTLSDWQQAISDPERWGFDPHEPYPLAALRRARLKGGGQVRGSARQRVVLPQGWMDDSAGDSFDEAWLQQDGLEECAYEG